MSQDLPPVETILPHRGRYLLLERLVRLELTEAEAVGSFTPEQVEGHYPDQPVVPGVLLLEGLAQTMACMQLAHPETEPGTPFLAGFEKVRFRSPVIPPAEVTFHVKLREKRFGLVSASGTAYCRGTRVCTARIRGLIVPPDGVPLTEED